MRLIRHAVLAMTLVDVVFAAPSVDYQKPGTHSIGSQPLDWRDKQRNRPVPVKIYYPTTATNPSPVIVLSHGLGGTRDTYAYLGQHWASHGYVCVHLQHQGSDDAVWRGNSQAMTAMKGAAADWRNALNRPRDVRFALDELTRLNQGDPVWKGRLDMSRVGMAGHSFGAWTTLAVAGLNLGPGGRISLADARVKSAIAMSAPANERHADQIYAGIKIPVYHLTGTRDNSPIGDTSAKERRIPFDHISAADQYLLTLNGGDHMIFSGRTGPGTEPEKAKTFLALILNSTTAFWHATLRDDATAKAWLTGGDFEKAAGNHGLFEQRASRPNPRESFNHFRLLPR